MTIAAVAEREHLPDGERLGGQSAGLTGELHRLADAVVTGMQQQRASCPESGGGPETLGQVTIGGHLTVRLDEFIVAACRRQFTGERQPQPVLPGMLGDGGAQARDRVIGIAQRDLGLGGAPGFAVFAGQLQPLPPDVKLTRAGFDDGQVGGRFLGLMRLGEGAPEQVARLGETVFAQRQHPQREGPFAFRRTERMRLLERLAGGGGVEHCRRVT